ncbi:CYB561A3 isoform 7 [Pan troglodytes]|uniref:ascorbate ferrireductase (transmembrane) n=2 Tax=Homininae TaxID=207598 RepID=F5H240_HUMAN|nr:cytochrome b561 family member A3 [Homo sapiens]KAI4071609.1 cytochrome b561 family member A3 [Homo sapiens]PNI45189.1 CYB561A3 isoform 7 [Pan troglodytes]
MVSGRFYLSCLLLGSLGSMCILFTIYWMQYWRGGFAWNGSIYMFNWHPVLMVAGMVVFYGGVVPGLCCLPPALGVHVAAQPPKTYPRLFWSRHPLSVHRIRHFGH